MIRFWHREYPRHIERRGRIAVSEGANMPTEQAGIDVFQGAWHHIRTEQGGKRHARLWSDLCHYAIPPTARTTAT